jgi:hypothetical protein
VLFQTSWGTFCEFDGNPMGPRNFFLNPSLPFPPPPPKRGFFFKLFYKIDVIFAINTHLILKTQVLARFILDKFIRLIPSYSLPHIIG